MTSVSFHLAQTCSSVASWAIYDPLFAYDLFTLVVVCAVAAANAKAVPPRRGIAVLNGCARIAPGGTAFFLSGKSRRFLAMTRGRIDPWAWAARKLL
jgi:hypothetical protein